MILKKFEIEKRLKERKRFKRPFTFETIKGELSVMREIRGKGVSLDLSEEGMGIESDKSFEKGEVIKLHFPIPRMGISIPVFAEVMWVKAKEDRVRAGLRFLQ